MHEAVCDERRVESEHSRHRDVGLDILKVHAGLTDAKIESSNMWSIRPLTIVLGLLSILSTACSNRLTVPSEVGTVDQLVNALRAQGLNATVGGQTSPQTNGYFSVSSRDINVDGTPLKAFEYETADKAEAEAALISADGQPNPRAQVGWISAPNFYRHGQLIVLYVGCGPIRQTLEELMGSPVARGPGCN